MTAAERAHVEAVAQGFPPTVEDPAALDKAATLLLSASQEAADAA